MKQISIITINYNNASGLEKTIRSVVEQTYNEYEYIIIDGASSDKSKEVIQEYQRYIDFWCSEKDSGIYNAMNKGIQKASGEYLLFLNSGDVLNNSAVLADIHGFLSGEDIVYGDLVFVRGDGEETVFIYPDILTVDYFLERSLGHPATFIKRELFRNCLYTESLKIVSDWEFFVKKIILEGCSYRHVKRTISNFDTSGVSSLSAKECNRERELVLKQLFSPVLREYFQEAEQLKKLPLLDIFLRLKKKDDRYFLCIYTNDDLTPFAKKIELLGNDCLCMSLRYEQVPLYLSIIDAGFVLRHNSLVNINASPTKIAEYMAVGAMVIATKYSGDAKVLVEDSGYGMILDEIENISSEMIDELNLKIHSYKENKENASATIKNYIFKSRLWHANEIKLKSLYSNI